MVEFVVEIGSLARSARNLIEYMPGRDSRSSYRDGSTKGSVAAFLNEMRSPFVSTLNRPRRLNTRETSLETGGYILLLTRAKVPRCDVIMFAEVCTGECGSCFVERLTNDRILVSVRTTRRGVFSALFRAWLSVDFDPVV
ncbi:hypothetical protein ACFQE1_00335 [Halobium palmae]|uniref:Uncharacterized protein n=1 Tax=Halobium palmae TaxID=1776492 RepID=A0ABD5RTZ5_9EURY